MRKTALAGLLAALGVAGAAEAGLDFCNDTTFVQSIAVGYQGDQDWTSEGWWNIQPGACATVVGGDLKKRYFYYRAEVGGGDFDGDGYFFCTDPSVFTIVGDGACTERGYDREEFREIDTGRDATDFTFTLVSKETLAPPAPDPGPPPVLPAPTEPVAVPDILPETVPEAVPESVPETAAPEPAAPELRTEIAPEADAPGDTPDIEALDLPAPSDAGPRNPRAGASRL